MPTFPDVPETFWGYADIEEAVKEGLFVGFTDQTFKPGAYMTRAQSATVLMRLKRLIDKLLAKLEQKIAEADDSFEAVGAQAEKCMVSVVNRESGELGSGTHFGAGYLLSNAHVALCPNGQPATRPYEFRWRGGGYGENMVAKYAEGRLVACKPQVDLAIFRIDLPPSDLAILPAACFGDPALVHYLQPVLVIGSPHSRHNSGSVGVVSAVDRYERYEVEQGIIATIPDMIQTDAAINPGNSGGGMFDKHGKLIGVPSMKIFKAGYEGLGFAIGLKTVATAVQEAKDAGLVRTMSAGVESEPAVECEQDLDTVLSIFASQGIRPDPVS